MHLIYIKSVGIRFVIQTVLIFKFTYFIQKIIDVTSWAMLAPSINK